MMGFMQPSNGVVIQEGLDYADRTSGDLLLDLYRPQTPNPLPVVIWLHGGGWFTGDRTLCPDLAQRAAATGLAYASIEYRLSGQATFPAALHDVRAAIRYLRNNAGQLGVEANSIGLWGASAGGHLALLTALTGHVPHLPGEPESPGEPGVQAVAESYAPTDLTVRVNGDQAPADDPATPEARLLGTAPTQDVELARRASPLHQVHGMCPPVQISHGTGDTLITHRQAETMHDALAAAGVDSELYLVEDYRHGFLNPGGRLDVEVAKVMDDGRLQAEGRAPSTYRSPTRPEAAQTTFGFADVDAFFIRHLPQEHL